MATPNSCPCPSNPFSSLRPLSLQTLLAELRVFYVYGMPLQPVNLAQLAIILYREEGKHPNCQFAVNNGILGGREWVNSFQYIVHQISPNFPFPSLLSSPVSLPSDRALAHVKLLQFMLLLTPHSVDAVSSKGRTKGGRGRYILLFGYDIHHKIIIDFLKRRVNNY